MAEISAAQVKAFRERTGLPLMDCKQALNEAEGNEEKAIEILRKRGEKLGEKRADRETAFGRFGLAVSSTGKSGAIVELKCESAPVTQNVEFVQLATDLAATLANTNVKTAEELLTQHSPSKAGVTLGDQIADMFNRIREKFEVGRMHRYEGPTGGYSHNSGTVAGVLLSIEGGNDDAAKNVAMHIAAMRPLSLSKEDLDQTLVNKERELLKAAALAEGKPENIVDKMVEGRLKNFYAERVLLEQPFVKDDKMTVGQYAKSEGMTIKSFVHYVLGQVG
jgi:elongation factor Ts